MPLNIRSEAVNQLAEKLASRAGVSKTEAVRIALENELQRRAEPLADFLEKIRPHLILKGQQADCALELWAKILESRALNGRFHWDDSLRRHAHYLMLRVQELNARGPEAPPPTLPDDVPTAVYRWGWWWEPEDSLFGPVEFEGKFPMNGRMISGHVYERPPVPTSSHGVEMLPTPTVQDAANLGGPSQFERNTLPLNTAVLTL